MLRSTGRISAGQRLIHKLDNEVHGLEVVVAAGSDDNGEAPQIC